MSQTLILLINNKNDANNKVAEGFKLKFVCCNRYKIIFKTSLLHLQILL